MFSPWVHAQTSLDMSTDGRRIPRSILKYGKFKLVQCRAVDCENTLDYGVIYKRVACVQ